MQQYTLTRTGKPPLSFSGELVAESRGEHFGVRPGGHGWGRFHNLAVYRTSGGAYVVQVDYVSLIGGGKRRPKEQGHSFAEAVASPQDVADLLGSMTDDDPNTGLCGANARALLWRRETTERMASTLAGIKERFARQVTEVLKADVFAERIE